MISSWNKIPNHPWIYQKNLPVICHMKQNPPLGTPQYNLMKMSPMTMTYYPNLHRLGAGHWLPYSLEEVMVGGFYISGKITIHPPKLTWNLAMMVSNRNLLFQGSIFRFHVCLGGCKFRNLNPKGGFCWGGIPYTRTYKPAFASWGLGPRYGFVQITTAPGIVPRDPCKLGLLWLLEWGEPWCRLRPWVLFWGCHRCHINLGMPDKTLDAFSFKKQHHQAIIYFQLTKSIHPCRLHEKI